MKMRHGQHVVSEDEQIGRYAYALGNVPASIADKAYAAAFARLSMEQRQGILDQLRAQLLIARQITGSYDPEAFAALMRDLYAREALVRIDGIGAFAAEFAASAPIVAYFTSGAGSVTVDHQPLWVQKLAGHETAPIDAGRRDRRHEPNFLAW